MERNTQHSLPQYLTLALLLWALVTPAAYAQEENLSMYHYTPFFTNPGAVGAVEDVRVMVNYRNQSLDADAHYTLSTVSGYYPVYLGNHRLVIGASFLNDRVTNYVTTNGGLLAVAYSLRMTRHSELSLGMQGGYLFQKSGSHYLTDDQYVNGAFDASIVSTDAVLNQSVNYPVLSTGLYYRVLDDAGTERAFLGGALFNVNQPNTAVAAEDAYNLPISIKATAGYRVYDQGTFSIMPTARWVHYAGNDFVNAGARLGYTLENTDEGVKKLALGAWYNTNHFGIFSFAYEQPSLTLALSYDVPAGAGVNKAQNGIVELALNLRLKKKAKPVTHTTTTQTAEPVQQATEETKETAAAQPTQPTQPAQETQEPQEAQETQETPAETPEATPAETVFTDDEKAVLARNVRFDLNHENLDAESRQFLDELVTILKTKDDYTIELVGHTCNQGAADFNQPLSVERAEAVKQYLVNAGLDASHFIVTGKGETEPLNDNSTPAARAENRRVAFKLKYD